MSSLSQTRDAILSAARSLFAQYGFKKTSMDDVARLAHVGKGTIYRHFENKEDLFAVLIQRESEALIHNLALEVKRAPDTEAKVRAFVEYRMLHFKELASRLQLTDETIMELLPLADGARKEYFEKEIDLLAEVFSTGHRSGLFDVKRPRLVAVVVLASLQGMEITLLRMRETLELEEGTAEALRIFFRGLANPVRPPTPPGKE